MVILVRLSLYHNCHHVTEVAVTILSNFPPTQKKNESCLLSLGSSINDVHNNRYTLCRMGKMLNFLIVTACVVFSTEGQTQDFCCPLKEVTMTSWSCRPYLCLTGRRKKTTTAISIIANLRSLVLTEIYLESTDCILELPADIFRKTVKTPVFIGDYLMDQR